MNGILLSFNSELIFQLTLNKLKELCESGGGAAAKEIVRSAGTERDEEELQDENSEEREEIERQMLQMFRYCKEFLALESYQDHRNTAKICVKPPGGYANVSSHFEGLYTRGLYRNLF